MDAATAASCEGLRLYFRNAAGSQYPALLNEHRIVTGCSITLNGSGGSLDAIPFQLEHGEIAALGFRFGNVAYTPDLNAIPKESRAFLEGLDLWIVDALRYTPHPSHLCLSETLTG